MKKIEIETQKNILVEILSYIHNICINNGINYSLIGGSLIGAIRHNGIIPWDDDIDIILDSEQYFKLIECIKNDNNKKYKLLNNENNDSYFYPFAKVVDTETIMIESDTKKIEDYGIYVDIFKYNNYPNNRLVAKIHYNRMMFYKKLIGMYSTLEYNKSLKNNILKKYVNIVGIKYILSKYDKICNFYNKKKKSHVISNWPAYGFKKELQMQENIREYEIVKFENIDVMIFKNYDKVLRQTFNDYMKLPPKEERISHHNSEAYWK